MPSGTTLTLRRIVWWSALYDLVLTLPFATPWTSKAMMASLSSIHDALALAGQMPAFEPLHHFFVNLFGSIVTLWAVIRLRDPRPAYGLYDAAGRTAFSAWMATYQWSYGCSELLGMFLVPEVLWGVVQVHAWWRWYGNVSRQTAASVAT